MHPIAWILAFLWCACYFPVLTAWTLMGLLCWSLVVFTRGMFRI